MTSNSERTIDVVQHALDLLRQYGWHIGYRKLAERLSDGADQTTRSIRNLFLGWQAWERGQLAEAEAQFQSVHGPPQLKAWATAGRAFTALRQLAYDAALSLFDQAATAFDEDPLLKAVIAHGRGTVRFHQGDSVQARRLLGEALRLSGPQPYYAPRILDTLGATWAGCGNFYAASEFFLRSLQLKQDRPPGEVDEPGVALTEGQLGRLYLDWGLLDRAEEHLRRDLEIVQRIDDRRSQAQIYNFLGVVAFRRAERHAAAGRLPDCERCLEDAAGWLDACVHQAAERPEWKTIEAFGRKDRALAGMAREQLDQAEADLARAEALFHEQGFAEGLAHVDRARGILHRRRARWQEAHRLLTKAVHHFDGREAAELARTQLEIARTRRAAGEPRPVVLAACQQALASAEACRRPALVGEIETELQQLDPLEHARHVFARVRGRGVRQSTTSLVEAERDTGSCLYLDIQGSTAFAHHRDPEEVVLTINQMMSDLGSVLRRFDARVSCYRGDGFLALFRGLDHAVRAVSAALELIAAVEEFNEPRRLLGREPLVVRTGVATGELCFGNVGTYDKMDHTAIGTPANLGARLEGKARPGSPCISDQTREAVGERFRYSPDSPRIEDLKGLGEQRFWFVVGRASSGSASLK